ncbi:MAG: thrombospondin type 3 repeat-containing protein, partial [candidate division Zixibacteria bacterium]|nr:thrombospondin type 3 repeat-containing protein [candidate division Zixibacteria bacterium]
YDDGDNSGVIGDYPCAGGNTVACDDNCQFDYNPDQEDADGDGFGDACQPTQSERYVNMKQWRTGVGGNGHWYAVLPELMLYKQADSVVRIPEKEGWLGGHLATITSQEENDFVKNNIITGLDDQPTVLDQFWMGGYFVERNIWKWINGEPFVYENWAPEEPNNIGVETIILMWGYHETYEYRQAGTWNNAMPNIYSFWSLVEWEYLYDNDLDGIPEDVDNCPEDYNPEQIDTDDDGLGNVCDDDDDGDNIDDWVDNCPSVYNPGQEDSLGNGVGDVCRSCCIGVRGNANCSPDDEIDISDITFIINLLYLGGQGQEFCCLSEADVDASGGYPDISDITKIIRYLYLDHEILPECPLRDDK